jgi:hypothetical protein|tara:strand:+ start:312 stop:887 length:576 start_codon:yes stop_codon:yes gene_type:complete
MTTTKKKTTTKAASLELPKYPFTFEVLDLVSRQRSKAKKIEVLKKYEHPSLKAVFIWNFDETVKSALPPGDVPYSGFEDQATYSGSLTTKIDEEVRKMHETGSFSMGTSDSQGRTTIRREYKNFYHFVKGGNDSMSGVRRETMFINVLEGLHPLEAEIVCLIKDKKLSDKYKITKEIVSEAYPDINWGGRS